MTLFSRFVARLLRIAERRPADFVIGGDADPYLLRWWLTPWSAIGRSVPPARQRWWQRLAQLLPGVYLHQFLRSDDDRALHDHPWCNASLLLHGQYTEHTIAAGGIHLRRIRRAGDLVLRRARAAHRIELHAGACWSLFFTGLRLRDWGFHCPEAGWVHWRRFTNPEDGGATVGKGCAP